MNLELTNVAVFPATKNSVNIGYGTATFNEGLQIRFNVRKTRAGAEFIAWPQSSYEKDGAKVYTNEVTLLKEVSDEINNQIITEFNKALAIAPTSSGPNVPKVDNAAKTSAVTTPTKKTKPKVSTNW